ncbi:LysR family transcriptional regulator [Metapseudomonas resinovorans]|uniref:LysR substrate-binding domain-containing protein n=1 Tax=Metapseudomonas resinovorans TaxID=53412 RepID=UPI000985E629|nr:LysR substrate-binding domain-containing protein [Pseudomonas resinovorans]GLZ89214.1 LysR family transcriptional regulator [Pseudomonas resinovorans]
MDKFRHPPSFQALQSFTMVAGSSSFTQAADVLCLTQSAVSRQIQQLESHFGVALFERNSRNVRLTAEGEQVLQFAQATLAQLRALEDRLSPRDRPFRIRLHVSLAVRWLLPRLSDFYRLHPGVSIAIETVATEEVEATSDCDAYIAYHDQPSTDPACLTLFDERLIPVCAPGLLESELPLRATSDLGAFALLHRSERKEAWEYWLKQHGGRRLEDYRHISFNLDELAIDAAARGLGIAMTDLTLAREPLERGALVIPFGEPLRTGGAYVLRLQPSASTHKACAAVLDWFRQQAEA